MRLVLRTSQRTSLRSSRPLTPRALRCCFRSRHRIKPAHGLWLKARAPLGRHQWPAFANRLVECQSTCPRGRHGERRSWNAASNLSAEPRWIRFDCHDPGHKSILKVSNFAQTPDAQRRKATLNRYAIAKRSVSNSTCLTGTRPGVRALAPKHVGRKEIPCNYLQSCKENR